MANFPTTLPSISNPVSTNFLNSPAHATIHGQVNDEVTAVATKIGTGASVPSSGTYLKGTGAGVSAWTALVINRAFGFFIAGVPAVANDLSWNPIAPQAMTCVKTWARCKTAPTGTNVILSIYNVTQGAVVGTVTINTGATIGNSTSFTTAAIAAGDVLRLDVTQADSNNIGANYSVVLETTQP